MGVGVGGVGKFKLCKRRKLCGHGEPAVWAGPLLALPPETANPCTAISG